MQPDRWLQVQDVIANVLDVAPADRVAVLDTACSDDPELRSTLNGLLPPGGDLRRLFEVPMAPTLATIVRAGDTAERPPEVSLLAAGTRIGPYEIMRLLGAGGMGQVYLARDARLERVVALKRVVRGVAADPVARARVLREARAAGSLTHPGIAQVYDVIDDSGALVIVMEYVEGMSLRDRLEQGPCGVTESIRICMTVADALGHAHAAGVVHCDIKPANIQLLPSGGVKILDFGIARRFAARPVANDRGTGRCCRHARLHVAGAGARPDAGSAQRSLLARGRPLRDAGRQARVRRRWRSPMVRCRLRAAGKHTGLFPAGSERAGRSARGDHPRASVGPRGALSECGRVPAGAERGAPRRRTDACPGSGSATATSPQPSCCDWRGGRTSRRRWTRRSSLAFGLGEGSSDHRSEGQQWFDDGVSALQEGAYLQASRAFERALQIDPGYAMSWARLGEAQLELDQERRAQQSVLHASSLVPDRSRIPDDQRLFLEAAMGMARRDNPAALRAYSTLASRNQKSAPLLVDLGRVHEAMGAVPKGARELPSGRTARCRESRAVSADGDSLRSGGRYGSVGSRLQACRGALCGARPRRGRCDGLPRARRDARSRRPLRRSRCRAAARATARHVRRQHLPACGGAVQIEQRGRLRGPLRRRRRSTRARGFASAKSSRGSTRSGVSILATCSSYRGQFKTAEQHFRQAVDSSVRAGASRSEARARLALGGVLMSIGSVAEATAEAKAAFEYYDQTGFLAQRTQALTLLARGQERTGDLTGAQNELRSASQECGRRAVIRVRSPTSTTRSAVCCFSASSTSPRYSTPTKA